MPDGAITPRKGRKFDQVLDGARKVFLADGFEGASVDKIARTAGVSKATLYSYFPDKRDLFMQVAQIACARQADQAVETIDMTAPARQVLTAIAVEMIEFLTSDFAQRIFRICVGEADRFPELGRQFYESGPMMVRERLMGYFQDAAARGELEITDFHLAADQFHELCKADIFPRMVFNIRDSFSAAEKQRVVDGAVATFLARYGAEGPPPPA